MLVHTSATKVADRLYEAGSPSGGEISFAGSCSDPQYMYVVGLPDSTLHALGIPQTGRLSSHIYVRCRKCEPCLAHRGRVWTARAVAETLASQRTWFGTLTLAPDRATQARFAADRVLQSTISERGDTSNQFAEMVNFVNPEITRFLKRVRKNSCARLRYLLVAEAHKTGIPHWHVLLHENAGKVTKRELETVWRFGFSHWRLVETMDIRAARYACKYLSKTALTRIRASRFYGSALPDALTERLVAASRSLAV